MTAYYFSNPYTDTKRQIMVFIAYVVSKFIESYFQMSCMLHYIASFNLYNNSVR